MRAQAGQLRSQQEPVSGTSKAIDDSPAPLSLAQLIKTANLAEANASEEDKIKAMMIQSCWQYNPATYMKTPPPSYTCFRCGKPGHYIKNCPTKGDKTFEPVPRIKKSTGIPRSFLVEVEDPSTRGAMLTNTGKYAIPIINAEAYARGKKEKPPFLPAEPPSSSSNQDPVPEELLCLICKNITTDAVIIPCCGNSYCDECIRTALLESEEHKCPTCHRTDVSPDALFANKFLRQAVNNFRNGTVYTERVRKQLWQQPPPLVTPPAAPVTNAELPSSSSLPIRSLSAEKDYQVPAPAQAALPHLLGPQGQPTPPTGQTYFNREEVKSKPDEFTNYFVEELMDYERSPKERMRSFSRSKSPCSALPYPRSSYTRCKSRSGSSCTRSNSRSRSRSRSRSHSPLPSSPRKGKGKSCNDRSRSTWRGDHHSWSRSPVFRGQSGTQRTTPQGEGQREYFNRHTAVPRYGMKAAYGRSVEFQDPFEKERYREWERNYGEWSGKSGKGCAAGAQPGLPPNRENFFLERFDPPESRREILPYAWGHRENYPGGHSHENHCIAGDHPEKPSGREHHGMENPTNSKEKETKNPLGDDRADKQRFQGKRRREGENEGFPNAELFEDAKKPREPGRAEDVQTNIRSFDSVLL
ncbi:LOW QUALITY PROTEIN: E3 ubiquitin-protein ligase RBBP6-like [Patagioenas fasciata]|uniref:LOW QUALITY PROTEIN: E3 ubiquitin-protein ligase RBBP6-like n=1 Tax=Patagioenas fasciata TaxID=372321 RepID=UPI003A9A2216